MVDSGSKATHLQNTVAISIGNTPCLARDFLLKKMSDAIQQAAKDGNIAVLRKASKKELNRPGEDGWTAVHWAAWNGNKDSLNVILDKGGDADFPDNKGFTALHVTAKYGHTAAAEVMLSRDKEVNLWALDNQGCTPARIAALSKKAECCRFLDNLAIHWQTQNPDYAKKMQTKAMKELSKRVERGAKGGQKDDHKDFIRRAYNHATAPSGVRGGAASEMKSSSATQLISGKRNKQSKQADMIRQNFELRTSSSVDHINTEGTPTTHDEEEEEDSGVLRPAGVRTGPLLNTLKSLSHLPPGKAGGASQESGFGSSSESYLPTASTSRRSSGSAQEMLLTLQPIVIENDSPLATFLQSLDLIDHIQLLHREKLDLEALALCEEKDLSDIGLPLGPRKKILNAVQRRQALMKKPGRMVDTEL